MPLSFFILGEISISSVLLLFLPALFGFFYSVLLETYLHHTEQTGLPVWRPAICIILSVIAYIMWYCWSTMYPIETILQYNDESANSTAIQILLSLGIFVAVVTGMLYASIRRIMTDYFKTSLSGTILVLRLIEPLSALLLAVYYIYEANKLVGENGFLSYLLH